MWETLNLAGSGERELLNKREKKEKRKHRCSILITSKWTVGMSCWIQQFAVSAFFLQNYSWTLHRTTLHICVESHQKQEKGRITENRVVLKGYMLYMLPHRINLRRGTGCHLPLTRNPGPWTCINRTAWYIILKKQGIADPQVVVLHFTSTVKVEFIFSANLQML